MINSKNKGKVAEREVAGILRAHGFDARRTEQYCGKSGDADVVGLPGYHVEVKRREKTCIQEWMAQAVRDCGENIPTVVHRRSREEWLITMRFEDFLKEVKKNVGQTDHKGSAPEQG